jgi:hypothetical protein
MRVKLTCIDRATDKFTTKNGREVKLPLLVMRDDSTPPLRNTVDLELRDEQVDKWFVEASVGRAFDVEVKEINQAFNGRIRLQGSVAVSAK